MLHIMFQIHRLSGFGEDLKMDRRTTQPAYTISSPGVFSSGGVNQSYKMDLDHWDCLGRRKLIL